MSSGEGDAYDDGDEEGGGLSYAESGYGFDGQTQAVLVAGRQFSRASRNQMRALRELAERWQRTLGRDIVSVPCGDVSPETGAVGDTEDDPAYTDVIVGVELACAHADEGASSGLTLEELREQTIDALRALPVELFDEAAAALGAEASADNESNDEEEGDGDPDHDANAWLAQPVGRRRGDEGLFLCSCGPLPSAFLVYGVETDDPDAADDGEVRAIFGCDMSQERHYSGVRGVFAASCEFSSQPIDLSDAAHDGRAKAVEGVEGKKAYFLVPRYD